MNSHSMGGVGREPNVERDLRAIVAMKCEYSDTAKSLLDHAGRRGYLTDKQYGLLSFLVNKTKLRTKPSQRVQHKTYVYGITDGEKLKVGVSKNVDNRLKTLQTGSATKLYVAWVKCVGVKRKKAFILERRIHKEFKDYRLEGEWFDAACLDMLPKFDDVSIYAL